MAQLKLQLSQEQAELTAVCAENIQAELDVYTVFLSKVNAALNVLFQMGVALAMNNGIDPDEVFMSAKTLVRAVDGNAGGGQDEARHLVN